MGKETQERSLEGTSSSLRVSRVLPPTAYNTQGPTQEAPKSVAGIFLSYHMQPGGEWSEDYNVMSLEDIRLQNLEDPEWPKSVTVHHATIVYRQQHLAPIFRLQLDETDS